MIGHDKLSICFAAAVLLWLPNGDILTKKHRNVTNLDLVVPMTFRDRFQRRYNQLGRLLGEKKLDQFDCQPLDTKR